MKKEQLEDLSFYVVELNQLLSELNQEAREPFSPNTKKIEAIAKAVEVKASIIKKLVTS